MITFMTDSRSSLSAKYFDTVSHTGTQGKNHCISFVWRLARYNQYCLAICIGSCVPVLQGKTDKNIFGQVARGNFVCSIITTLYLELINSLRNWKLNERSLCSHFRFRMLKLNQEICLQSTLCSNKEELLCEQSLFEPASQCECSSSETFALKVKSADAFIFLQVLTEVLEISSAASESARNFEAPRQILK